MTIRKAAMLRHNLNHYPAMMVWSLSGITLAACSSSPQGGEAQIGTDGNDTLTGGEGQDTFYGRGGDDLIRGGKNRDFLAGDEGDDVISGGDGNDQISGGEGDDVLNGGQGDDDISGDEGDDATHIKMTIEYKLPKIVATIFRCTFLTNIPHLSAVSMNVILLVSRW